MPADLMQAWIVGHLCCCSLLVMHGRNCQGFGCHRLCNAGTPAVDREMFALMWSPTVAAVSVVLDHAEDPAFVRLALDGLLCAARLASHHRLDQV